MVKDTGQAVAGPYNTIIGKSSPAMTIDVPEEIIRDSVERNSGHCMVAEAIREHAPHMRYIAVDIQTIRCTDLDKGERYTYLTPRSVQLAIIKFDQGVKPNPFVFRLRGAQITKSGKSSEERAKDRERATALNLNKKQREKRAFLKLAKAGNSIPDKIGGVPPPTSTHRHPPVANGIRRAFGIRAFEV